MSKRKKVMVALGGNALGATPSEQLELVKKAADAIADIVEAGNDVIIAHGNGPQVGMINLGLTTGFEAGKIKAPVPFPECGAMSEGYIGYHLQNALDNEFSKRGTKIEVATVVSQVIVDKEDTAFQNPTKPIGSFYTKEEAERLSAETGNTYREDAGRGYRRVIASPKPIDVVEKKTIGSLVNAGVVVIAVGGGGIPVIIEDGKLKGIDAVIDKDFAAEKLAEILECDVLLILTAVEQVAINFGKPEQKNLFTLSLNEAEKYIEEKQFAPGSMLPKIQAAEKFALSGKGRTCIITSLEKAIDGFLGKTGTCVSAN